MLRKALERARSFRSIEPDRYRDLFTSPKSDFTRSRKLRLLMGVGDRPAASAFIQQRDKLTGGFYRRLFEESIPEEDAVTPFMGKYAVIACDGSDVCLHPDPSDTRTLLKLSNNPNGLCVNQVHLNALSAVPDGWFMDCVVQDCADMDEFSACTIMMKGCHIASKTWLPLSHATADMNHTT